MTLDHPLTIVVDGQVLDLNLMPAEPLVRAVIVSLFTWRRANADDELPGNELMGWWADTYADVPDDRIGSRLWLLSRSVLSAKTVVDAKDYATEALQWLLDDGVASAVQATGQRIGLNALGLTCVITRKDTGQVLDLRFADVWSFLKNAA